MSEQNAKKPIDRDQVRHIARLANMALRPDEEEQLREQLNHLLEYFERLDRLKTDNVQPMSHSASAITAFAVDVVGASGTALTQQEALANAPDSEAGQFKVPAVLE